MPDLLSVLFRRWKLILLLPFAGTLAAFTACLLLPKLYLGKTTALPVNTLVNDKARILNQNIEALYSEIGTADELDKLEGTAQLDTVFLAVAEANNLKQHYQLDTTAGNALEKAALMLRRKSNISRTGYGELQIKVWDENNRVAASLANALLQTINAIHQRLQNENSWMVLQKLHEQYQVLLELKEETVINSSSLSSGVSTEETSRAAQLSELAIQQQLLNDQLVQYQKLIYGYEMAVRTIPNAVLVVERARPLPWHDKPNTAQTVLLAFFASLLFSFLLAVFVESRKVPA